MPMDTTLKSELVEYMNELHGWETDEAQFQVIRDMAARQRQEAASLLKQLHFDKMKTLPSKEEVNARRLN